MSKPKAKPPGRPRVPAARRSVARTLTMPAPVWRALDTAAAAAGTTPSRHALALLTTTNHITTPTTTHI